ncbi:MAG: hypothetical protein D8M52_09190 [Chlorobi bacterium]|nr:MAG: hypothetical protein F9K28_08180 [Bacteroidota bacterium]KXK33826.1 MAG: hypothetical protein UZ06_CHB003001548 [Chlorobi bacterium OLB6]MBL1161876.1 hypothetical protein [Chlorobiota bacterium]MBZ0195014.1 hypothetical protein [Candidatus Kapabacteria bacterium]MCL4277786.1 hypothetical protein [Ignavibacteria bacterium]
MSMHTVRIMSSALKVTYIAMAILLVSVAVVRSQEPCETDCDTATSPYETAAFTIEFAPGCLVTIQYRTRVCAGISEMIVDAVNVVGPCADMLPSGALQVALQLLVTQNQMNFPPYAGSNEGSWTWRISRNACWKRLGSPPSGPLIPCSDECCVNYINVRKRQGCDYWEFVSESATLPWRVCPDVAIDPGGGEQAPELCTSACAYLVPILRK